MDTPLQNPLLAPCSHSPCGRTGCSAPGLLAAKLCPSAGAGGEAKAGSGTMAYGWAGFKRNPGDPTGAGRTEHRGALLEQSPSARKENRGRTPLLQQHPHNRWKLRGGISSKATVSLPCGVDFCAPSAALRQSLVQLPQQRPPAPFTPQAQGAAFPRGPSPGSTGIQGMFSVSSFCHNE